MNIRLLIPKPLFLFIRFLRVLLGDLIPKHFVYQHIQVWYVCLFRSVSSEISSMSYRKYWWYMKCTVWSSAPICLKADPFHFLTSSWEAAVPEWWRLDCLCLTTLFIPWRTEPLCSSLLLLDCSSSSLHSHSVQAQPAVLPLLCGWT